MRMEERLKVEIRDDENKWNEKKMKNEWNKEAE